MDSVTTPVTVTFLNGEVLCIDLAPEDTIQTLRDSAAAGSASTFDIALERLVLTVGSIIPKLDETALSFGTSFSAVVRRTLGIEWKCLAEPMAPWAPRYGNAAVVFDDCLWIIAGTGCWRENGVGGDEDHSKNIWIKRSKELDWERQPEAPWQSRTQLAACADRAGRLFVFGGEDGFGTTFTDSWAFDGSSWQQLPDVPWGDKLPDCATGLDEGAIVVADGAVYEFKTEWTKLHDLPKGVNVSSCATFGEELYIGTNGRVNEPEEMQFKEKEGAEAAEECVVMVCKGGQWSVLTTLEKASYCILYADSTGELFIFGKTDELDGIGTLWTTERLSHEIVPRFNHHCESMGVFSLHRIWGGLVILSCCGHIMYSE